MKYNICNNVNPRISSAYEEGYAHGVFSCESFTESFLILAEYTYKRLRESTDEEKQNPEAVVKEVIKPLLALLKGYNIQYELIAANPLGWVVTVPKTNKRVLLYANKMLNTATMEYQFIPAYQIVIDKKKPRLYEVSIQKPNKTVENKEKTKEERHYDV